MPTPTPISDARLDWQGIAMTGRVYADNLIGEPAVSKVMHLMADEIEKLRSLTRFQDRVIRSGDTAVLTTAEDTALERAAIAYELLPTEGARQVAEALVGLRERLGSGGEVAPTAKSDAPPQPEPAPDWMSRPYWVDPPSGWRYGFPRLYDPRSDGPMRLWLVKNGYPQAMADQNLHCTFTACEEKDQ